MLVLGLQGSPRRKGNSAFLLSSFLDAARELGARTEMVEVDRRKIMPCKELVVCEKKGFCPIDDEMKSEIYGLLREAEVVVLASPVFFYNVTAQLKALIDRCQTLWARKYRLHLKDPFHRTRRGILLAVGATRGKNLFEGLNLTAQYFCDAVGAAYDGMLTYRGIEEAGAMARHPTARQEVQAAAERLLTPLVKRKRILFAGRSDDSACQMAAALTQWHAAERLDVASGGSAPAAQIDPRVIEVLQAQGIDLAFRRPRPLQEVAAFHRPQLVVDLGGGAELSTPGVERLIWDLKRPAVSSPETVSALYTAIELKVKELVARD